ncbi:MAG TPA: TetR/AcrR family transcriptional regulator [Acidimicrobiales bacterium]|nr:TetR/AcrR family transcriptional regulator [Acidimicrobiales bacterium]
MTQATSPRRSDPAPGGRRIRGRTLAERQRLRREAMLDAGLELFGTRGYAGSTVDAVCRRAGVSTRNFYEEFDNRLDLLVAVGERIAAQAFAAWTTEYAPPAGPRRAAAALRARVAALVHALVDDPRVARIVFVESLALEPEGIRRRRELMAIFPSWIASYLDGHFDGLGIPPRRRRALARAAFGAGVELVSAWVLDGGDDDAPGERGTVEDLVDDVVEASALVLRLGPVGASTAGPGDH